MLENVYGINPSRIYHIHGALNKVEGIAFTNSDIPICNTTISLSQEQIDCIEVIPCCEHNSSIVREEIQFGNPKNFKEEFNHYLRILDKERSENMSNLIDAESGIVELAKFYDATYKDINCNFDKLNKFINKNITEVIVFGHSLLGVDEIYYKDILVPQLRNKRWVFYYHSSNDKKSVREFINKYKLHNVTIKKSEQICN